MNRQRLLFVGLSAACISCKARPVPAPWSAGSAFFLTLVATSPRPALTPERERSLAPVSDTARLGLVVDSVVRDSAFGRAEGDTRHFWVPFRAIGGDRFTATRQGGAWRIVLNGHVTDAGMSLDGQAAEGTIRGTWTSLGPSTAHGVFTMILGAQ